MITHCLFCDMYLTKIQKRSWERPPDCGHVAPSSGLWWALQTQRNLCVLFLLLLVEVALVVEVTEEDDEGDAVTKHQHVHGVWEVALCEQVVARVQQEQQELHLERQSEKVQISRFHKHIVRIHSSFHTEQEPLTSCRDVRYRFHHRYFCMWGPMAARP